MTGSNNRNCAVPLCESYGDVFDNNRNRYMTYHKIPSNQEVKQAWVQRIRREELTQRLKYVTDSYESANLSCFAADRLFLALSRSRSTQLSARFISGMRTWNIRTLVVGGLSRLVVFPQCLNVGNTSHISFLSSRRRGS